MQIIKKPNNKVGIKPFIFWFTCSVLFAVSIILATIFYTSEGISDFKFSKNIPAPVASIPSCYSNTPIDLKFSTPPSGTNIYYTLDGTRPGPNSMQYDG